jgi:hypothetical protein
MPQAITGGCRCGAIRYELKEPPTLKHICCCRDCQSFTGTDKVFVVGGPRNAFVLRKGEPISYAVTADSGATIQRAFCGTCGSSLFIYPQIDGVFYKPEDDVIEACAGTLDDPNAFTPDSAVFVSRAPMWAAFPKDLPLHD